GRHCQIKQCVGFPARVAECLREGQPLLEMVCGLVEFAALAVDDSDHEIAIGDVAAAAYRAEDFPAGCQEGKSLLESALLPAHLGEKEHGLCVRVRVVEPSAEVETAFEAGGRVR